MAAEGVGTAAQLANVTDNLRQAADLAARGEVTLGFEPMVAVPGMLLQSAYSAAELVSRVNHPADGLIFDTGHEFGRAHVGTPVTNAHLVCWLRLAKKTKTHNHTQYQFSY